MLLVILSLTKNASIFSMEKPRTIEPSLLSLSGLPTELQAQITNAITNSDSLGTAIQTIRALTLVDKQFNQLINDASITNNLITDLATKWTNGDRIRVALALKTPGAKRWFSTAQAQQWFKSHPKLSIDLEQIFKSFIQDLRNPGSREMLMLFLDIGFTPNPSYMISERYGSSSPLNAALENNDPVLFKKLLEAGADLNTYAYSSHGRYYTILEKAVEAKNYPIIKMLLEAGANPNPKIGLLSDKTLIESLEEIIKAHPTESEKYQPIIELLAKYVQAPSLRQQSLKAVAQQIKSGQITLEQAKKKLPADLQKQLEEMLKSLQ
jgi:hypothetical protein